MDRPRFSHVPFPIELPFCAGRRFGPTNEAALKCVHLVVVPILNLETDETTLLIPRGWRIPTDRQGPYRTVVVSLQFRGESTLARNSCMLKPRSES
jgi:hypothetical protein